MTETKRLAILFAVLFVLLFVPPIVFGYWDDWQAARKAALSKGDEVKRWRY